MEQSDKEADDMPGRMPLNAGDSGYGTVPGAGLSASAVVSESAPLLIPEAEGEPAQQWQPLTKEELEVVAGGPAWRKARCYLVLLFWLAWVAMLVTSVAVVMTSPRPVATPLQWWQKTLFYQLQPDLTPEGATEGSRGMNALCEQLPYLKSLGIGALILEGLFDRELSPVNLTAAGKRFSTLAQTQHLLTESSKIGLKVVLDLCELDGAGISGEQSNLSAAVHHTLQFWLEEGVAGFSICDMDAGYSEKTLLEWRGVFKNFNSQEYQRILVVKQKHNVVSSIRNFTLVDVIMRPILPSSQHLLSAEEVADAIEAHLQTREDDIWPSWTVGGKASHDLKKLLLVLMMTLPGTPAVQYDEDMDQSPSAPVRVRPSPKEENEMDTPSNKEETRRSAVALFTSLSHSRAQEEALLFGSFTFLPYNSSTNSSSNSTLVPPSSPPVLAFLRSWGCVHFLVLLNVGPTHHALNPGWAPSLPDTGVFVVSSGMDRLGSMTLDTLEMRPHEAIVIKLFEAGSYS